MTRRSFLGGGVFLTAAPHIAVGRSTVTAGAVRREYSTRAIDAVRQARVIDMLGLLTLNWPKLYAWQGDRTAFCREDFDRLKRSGITVFHPSVEPNQPDPFAATLAWTERWNCFVASHRDCFVRVGDVSDIAEAKTSNRIGIIVGFQNSDHFRGAEDVRLFHSLGQRVSQLTYNTRNAAGAGCLDREDCGLTDHGAALVKAMNEVGMAVDVSHASERTALDSFGVSSKPVLITHSNCRAMMPSSPRCVGDETIRGMAATGGVMGITAIRNFIWHKRPVTIGHLLDHYDHVARLVGVEHVGLGSDSDVEDEGAGARGKRFEVAGLRRVFRAYDIAEGLLRRGYTPRHLELILGGNFERALRDIWIKTLSESTPFQTTNFET
ncbi:MAG: membrane dipeptidase [Bryobacteraceae bacterium]|nr:membrane dipeptidase [Bryobacteraceae bacterium]